MHLGGGRGGVMEWDRLKSTNCVVSLSLRGGHGALSTGSQVIPRPKELSQLRVDAMDDSGQPGVTNGESIGESLGISVHLDTLPTTCELNKKTSGNATPLGRTEVQFHCTRQMHSY